MKSSPRHIILFVFLILNLSLEGQNIAINKDGSAPDNSAMLDISSTDAGVLVPRLSQAQRNAISNPATGLLLFQTDNTPGFYFNAGTPGSPNWTMISTGSSAGDAIQDADNNTKIQVEENTNENLIRFDVDGSEVMRIGTLGRIQTFNANNSVFLGSSAGNSIVAGSQNVFVGFEAGSNTSNASNNTYVGFQAGKVANATGNTIVGSLSGDAINSGSNNTMLGLQSGSATDTGADNVFLGKNAGRINSGGSGNVYLGSGSGDINNGNGNTFIGFNAGAAQTTASNRLFIDNSNTNTPLIYGDFANDTLRLNGVLNLDSAKNGNGYTFPGLDGSSGQFLTTNGSGKLQWANAASTAIWTSAGQLVYPSATNNRLAIGTTSIESNYKMEIAAGSGSNTKGLFIRNTANAGANDKVGIEILLDQASSKRKYGIINRIAGTPNQADSLIGIHSILTPDNNASLPFAVNFRSSFIGVDGETYGMWSEGEKYNYFQGNVGIGEGQASNPLTAIFTGTSSSAATASLKFGDNSAVGYLGASSTNISLYTDDAIERISVQQGTGNIGIGTNNPYKKLHVQSGGTSLLSAAFGDGSIFSSNSASGARFFFENLNAPLDQKTLAIVNENVGGQGTTYFGSLTDNGGAWVNILMSLNHSSGFVGFGTVQPAAKLHVTIDGGSNGLLLTSGTSGSALSDGFAVGIDEGAGDQAYVLNQENTDLLIGTNATERMRIDNTGNIGIGESSPSSALDVAGDVEVGLSDAFYFGDPDTNGSWRYIIVSNSLEVQRRESGTWVTKTIVNP